MQPLQKDRWYSRLLVLTVALLISNVAALSCAVAMTLSSDCPDHTPVTCLESCSAAQATINDKNSGNNSYGKTTPVLPASLPAPELGQGFTTPPATNCRINVHDPSPPLNLLYCVFLK